jgi:DNA-binding XRE family transcriptional regulator
MNIELFIKKRKNFGYSQQKMAYSLGYKDKSSYCFIEKNKVSITLDIAKKIKQILKLSDQELGSIFFNEKV